MVALGDQRAVLAATIPSNDNIQGQRPRQVQLLVPFHSNRTSHACLVIRGPQDGSGQFPITLIYDTQCLWCIGQHPLIDPVPDKTALQRIVCFDGVPIVLQVADTVAHGVGVFTQNQRPVRVLFRVADNMVDRRVHGAVDIGVAITAGTFVVHRARGVAFLDPVVDRMEIDTVSGLVAHRPDDHRRVVLVPLDHPPRAVHVSFLPGRVLGQ